MTVSWSRATADTDARSSAAHPTMKHISTFPENAHPTRSEGSMVTKKAGPDKNRARSRRRRNYRP